LLEYQDSNTKSRDIVIVHCRLQPQLDNSRHDKFGGRLKASGQPGFLGVESVRDPDGLGITVSYWKDKKSIREWKNHTAHQQAQKFGKDKWYQSYRIRVAKVDLDYGY